MDNKSENDGWKGVPLVDTKAWQASFAHDQSKIRIDVPCPLCGRSELFRWHDGGRGLWQWCGACMVYEHSTALTPYSWDPEVSIKPLGLTALPTAIVEALREVRFL